MSPTPHDVHTNHREHDGLRLDLQYLRAALDSLAAYAEAIANLRSLREVADRLHSLQADILAHFVHEEQTVLDVIERLSPDDARFAKAMRDQHELLNKALAGLFQMLNEIHDSNDLRSGLVELQVRGDEFARLLFCHIESEDRRLQALPSNQSPAQQTGA